MKRLYIGPKRVAIENCNFFDGAITLFDEVATFEYWNPDNNQREIDIYNEKLAQLDFPAEIMAYNPKLVSQCIFPENVYQICKNSDELLNILDDKIQTRSFIKSLVPMLDYCIVKGKEFDSHKLCTISKDLVVQSAIGSGGSRTFMCNQENYARILKRLSPDEDYSVSAYQYNNVPYNIHCMIGSNQIVLFLPSCQEFEISDILEYIGNNFETSISIHAENKLREYSIKICEQLQKTEYRGVLGIDYIYANGELYFIEINPRFQGSTRQLDNILKRNGLPSIFDYNYRAFTGKELPEVSVEWNKSVVN